MANKGLCEKANSWYFKFSGSNKCSDCEINPEKIGIYGCVGNPVNWYNLGERPCIYQKYKCLESKKIYQFLFNAKN